MSFHERAVPPFIAATFSARLVVSLVIAGYVALAGVPPVLLVFVVIELAGAVVQGLALRRA